MSRSFKKNVIKKDSASKSKKIANRKYRRKVKDATVKNSENLPLMNEVVDPYSINDNGRWMPSKDDKKWYDRVKRK